jgi:hypothetical protein
VYSGTTATSRFSVLCFLLEIAETVRLARLEFCGGSEEDESFFECEQALAGCRVRRLAVG